MFPWTYQIKFYKGDSNSEDRLKEMVITNLIQVLEAEQNKNKVK